MKKIALAILIILLPVSLFAYESPGRPVGFVNDFADIIDPAYESQIQSKLSAISDATGFQVLVATVNSLDGETVEGFATELFEEWGIGESEIDNGILILIAPNEREMRIETGYGAEGALTDIQSGNIIRSIMTPAFSAGNYGEGIVSAVDAISLILSDSPEAEQYSQVPEKSSFDINFGALFFIFIFVVNILARFLGKSKSWWLGGVIGAGIGAIIWLLTTITAGIISIIILSILGLIFDYFVSKKPPGSGGGGFWPMFFGGGHGGRGGGNFPSFGGGMSGGGGASGRW